MHEGCTESNVTWATPTCLICHRPAILRNLEVLNAKPNWTYIWINIIANVVTRLRYYIRNLDIPTFVDKANRQWSSTIKNMAKIGPGQGYFRYFEADRPQYCPSQNSAMFLASTVWLKIHWRASSRYIKAQWSESRSAYSQQNEKKFCAK